MIPAMTCQLVPIRDNPTDQSGKRCATQPRVKNVAFTSAVSNCSRIRLVFRSTRRGNASQSDRSIQCGERLDLEIVLYVNRHGSCWYSTSSPRPVTLVSSRSNTRLNTCSCRNARRSSVLDPPHQVVAVIAPRNGVI